MTYDVVKGREKLNFSTWGAPQAGEGQEANELAEAVQNSSMPPQNYLLLHPEAHLSATEAQQLRQGLQVLAPAGGTGSGKGGEGGEGGEMEPSDYQMRMNDCTSNHTPASAPLEVGIPTFVTT